jgi:hypothetical protein
MFIAWMTEKLGSSSGRRARSFFFGGMLVIRLTECGGFLARARAVLDHLSGETA